MTSPRCTCIEPQTISVTAALFCPIHMPPRQPPAFLGTAAGAGNPGFVGGVVTFHTCPACGSLGSLPCPFCAERAAQQERFRDVARRARENERARCEKEIADGVETFPALVPMQHLPAALAKWIRSGDYRRGPA